jgi:hypothetical protein
LTFIDEGTKNIIDGKINFLKMTKWAEVIRDIQTFQQIPYEFYELPSLQKRLKHIEVKFNDKELYKQSLIIEPRQKDGSNNSSSSATTTPSTSGLKSFTGLFSLKKKLDSEEIDLAMKRKSSSPRMDTSPLPQTPRSERKISIGLSFLSPRKKSNPTTKESISDKAPSPTPSATLEANDNIRSSANDSSPSSSFEEKSTSYLSVSAGSGGGSSSGNHLDGGEEDDDNTPPSSLDKILPKLNSLTKMTTKKQKRDFRIVMDDYQTMQTLFTNSLDSISILGEIEDEEDEEKNEKEDPTEMKSTKDLNITITKETMKEFLKDEE